MNIDLSNQRILVTGSSRGIGKAISEALLDAGAQVGLHYNSTPQGIELLLEKHSGAKGIRANLGESSEVLQLFNEFTSHFGGIDVLVNNAGIAIQSSINDEDNQFMQDWRQTMEVNLGAVALLTKKAIQSFVEQESGRVINISSRAAFRGDTAEYLAYAASKGGMVAFTRSIARAYGKNGITAFNIAPGFTRTEMAQDFIDEYGEEYATSDLALNKMTEPKDIAPLVVFLASGLADHATGSTIDVNAGSYVH